MNILLAALLILIWLVFLSMLGFFIGVTLMEYLDKRNDRGNK